MSRERGKGVHILSSSFVKNTEMNKRGHPLEKMTHVPPVLPELQVAIENTSFAWRLSFVHTPWCILGSSSCCLVSLLPAHHPVIKTGPGRGSSWTPSVTSSLLPPTFMALLLLPGTLLQELFLFVSLIFSALSSGSHPVLLGYCSSLIGFPVYSILSLPHCLHTGTPTVYWTWVSIHCSSVGMPCVDPRCLWTKGLSASTVGLVQFVSSLFHLHYPLHSQKHDALCMLN